MSSDWEWLIAKVSAKYVAELEHLDSLIERYGLVDDA